MLFSFSPLVWLSQKGLSTFSFFCMRIQTRLWLLVEMSHFFSSDSGRPPVPMQALSGGLSFGGRNQVICSVELVHLDLAS